MVKVCATNLKNTAKILTWLVQNRCIKPAKLDFRTYSKRTYAESTFSLQSPDDRCSILERAPEPAWLRESQSVFSKCRIPPTL